MEKNPFGLGKRGYALMIAVAAALGGLLFGYDTSVISGAILFVRRQFHLTVIETEVAVSIVLAGAAVGAAVAGYFGDRFGRRPVLIVNAILFGAFAVITGLANGLPLFLAARLIVGVAVGVASMLTPLYIAELAPPKIRGALVTLNQLAIVTGIVVAYYVDYLFSASAGWRGMFISAVVPSVILLVALIFLPESPRWLVTRQQPDAAFRILDRVESTQEARRHLEELQDVTQADRLRFRDLFGERFRRPLLIGVGLAVFQQVTGVNTIIYYTPTILQMAGFKSASSAILATVLVGGVNLVMTVIALFLLDRIGRRPLLLIGIAGMGISLAHLGYLFGASHVSRVGILTDVLAYLACFAIGLGPVFWLLISEIYPTTIRGQAMSVASLTIWIFDLLVSVTFLSLVGAVGTKFSFWIYAAACVAAFVFSYYLVPETKGRTLEEIENSWGGRKLDLRLTRH
ncbi:MAG: sugar porter family MFS transporter [Acidobacteria bacterium]|nr:sugar porter family MFS transporter [Acidobacteriota bacterium]